MNLFRTGEHLADYTTRILCAAVWIAGINGYIFTDQHPDYVFKVALYGSLLVLVSLIILSKITTLYTDSTYTIRNNIITTAVMCWALPGIILTPPAHYNIINWLIGGFLLCMIILKPLFHLAADRHDNRRDRDEATAHMPAAELMENN